MEKIRWVVLHNGRIIAAFNDPEKGIYPYMDEEYGNNWRFKYILCRYQDGLQP